MTLLRYICGLAFAGAAVCAQSITITTTPPLPVGGQGIPYSYTLSATGGTLPYTWTLAGGALPNGIMLSLQGKLGGTPTTGGAPPADIAVQVMDSLGATATAGYTITITPPVVIASPSPLPSGTLGGPYSQTLNANGGTAPYWWTVVSTGGPLPPGLTLTTAGVLGGTTTAAGVYNFVIQALDANAGAQSQDTKSFSLAVNPSQPFSPVTILNGTPFPPALLLASYSQTMNGAGGTPPYTWSVTSGQLPPGLTLTTAGVLSGGATVAGTWNFVIQAVDSGTLGSATKGFSLTAMPLVTINNPSPLPPAMLGPFTQAFNASGGTPPYTWSLASGPLPPGLTLSATGVLAGTTTAAGTWNFTIQVLETAPQGVPVTKAFSLTVNAPALTVTSMPFLAPSTVGVAYTRTLQAGGGVPPYIWSIVSGSPPTGVTMNSSGVLSGTPTAPANFTFTAKVSDSAGPPSMLTVPVQAYINPPLDFGATSPLPTGVEGIPYSFKFLGSGGTPPISGSIASGALPTGLTLGSAGSISGTPTAVGSFNVTLEATDGVGFIVSRAFVIAINSRMTITTASPLPAGTAGVAYSQNLSVSGGALPVVWSIASGSLPTGLVLSAAGVLSGTPAAAAGASFSVQASDAAGGVATRQLTLSIAAALTITTTTLSGGNVGIAYTRTLVGAGGKPPYTWTVSSGALPSGVTLATSGRHVRHSVRGGRLQLFGTVNGFRAGDCHRAAAVDDRASAHHRRFLRITGRKNGKALYANTRRNGRNAAVCLVGLRWRSAAGLTFNGSGVIAGAPAAAGNFNFNAQIKDSAGVTATAFLSLAIASLPAIGTASQLASAVTGTPYQQSLSASGGTPPYTWSLQGGALPGGLALDAQSGVIGGMPSAAGRASFTVQVQDGGGTSAVKAFELTVTQTLQVSPAALVFRGASTAQSIQIICSTAGAPLSISSSAAWLQASAAHAVSPAAVSIGVDARALAAGTYRGSVTIACGDASQDRKRDVNGGSLSDAGQI